MSRSILRNNLGLERLAKPAGRYPHRRSVTRILPFLTGFIMCSGCARLLKLDEPGAPDLDWGDFPLAIILAFLSILFSDEKMGCLNVIVLAVVYWFILSILQIVFC